MSQPSSSQNETREKISELRSLLRTEPRRPLAWTELARHHLSRGSASKAEKAMQCALTQAPQSRYVLRSAARFFERIGDPDQALRALKRSGRLGTDPWLLSADIALKGDRRSNSMKVGIRMLEDAVSTPRSLSELAAAVGTVEHENGRHKAAKKMIVQSLVDPNENSIAQAIYISQNDTKIKLPDELLDHPLTFEARARKSFATAAWKDSMQQSWKWLRDEPFDTRPAVLGSCLGFDKNLAQEAYDIATEGLACSPNDGLLLNNRAVAGAYLNRLDAAFSDVSHALRFDSDRAYLLATLGLIAYRSGNIEAGARAYGLSIAWLVKQKEHEAVIRAYLYWLREAVRVGQVQGEEEMHSAKKLIDRLPDRETENEVPGLLEAIQLEIDVQRESGASSALHRQLDEDAILDLETKIAVPEEARGLYPLIVRDLIPEIDEVKRLSR